MSFKPDEITSERAMQLAEELCHRLLQEQYQYVLAIHEDHQHLHAHVVFNNTNFVTGKTFETEHNQGRKSNRAWAEIRRISDEICKENCLSVIEHPEQSKGKSHWEWDISRQGLSWKAKLKYAIDQVIKDSEDFSDFLQKCVEKGIHVEYNPDHKIDLKFMLAEQKENNPRAKFTRSRTLGWFYETEQIKRRIALYKGVMVYTPRTKIKVIDSKENTNKFVRDAIDRQNMKITSKAMNILSKYDVSVDEAKNAAVAAFAERTSLVGELNKINAEIKEREEQLFWLTHYLEVKPFHDEYMSLKGRKQKKYGEQFDAELYRYDSWESELKKVFPKKFPNVKQLEEYIEKLKEKRDIKNVKYKSADQKSRELSEAAREIEKYLSQEQSREQQKKKKRNDLE